MSAPASSVLALRRTGCGRPPVETVGGRKHSERRQADALQGTSSVHRAARHGDLLPRLSGKWRGIEMGQALGSAELTHAAAVLERRSRKQSAGIPGEPAQGRLL